MTSPQFDPQIYLRQPFEVSIETLTLCNARCTFCPYPTLERKGTEISAALWHSLVEQLAQFERPFFLSPFKVNEPLLDRHLIERLEFVNHRVPKARIRLFTNGSPLTERKIVDIACLDNVEHLWVSLNSTDPIEYEALMGLKFDHTARRLDDLHRACETSLFTHKVFISRVSDSPWSAASNEPFNTYCRNRWPAFVPFHIKRDGWLGFVEPASPLIPRRACSRWFELSILSTGVVSLCCMDGEGKYVLGNVNEQTLLEVYNSPYWIGHREHAIQRGDRMKYHPCSTCTY